MAAKQARRAELEIAQEAPTPADLRVKIDAAERRLAEERAALGRVAQAREALFASGATEESVVEHDAHSRRLEIRIRLAAGAVRKLEDELATAEAAEADAARKVLHVKADGLKQEYALHLRKADGLARQIADELRAAALIEDFFKSNLSAGLDAAELQDFRDDRPQIPARPATIETVTESYLFDRQRGHECYGGMRDERGNYMNGIEERTRRREVVHPYHPAEPLPPLRSMLELIRLPALRAGDGWLWGK